MDITTKLKMNNGKEIHQFGLGVWRGGAETKNAVLAALKAGYRHIDTAAVYGNEEQVGEAIRESGIPRDALFITTKVWNEDMRKHTVKAAFELSLKKLGLDYVDLYLIHWPVKDEYIHTYKVLESLYESGKAKAIGVSNFKTHHLQDLLDHTDIVPAVNQMEFNPQMQDNDILKMCTEKGILLEAWSPLGSGACLNDENLKTIGGSHGKSEAQVIIRWLLQKGIVVFPKSVHENRIIENADVFDFTLNDEEMALINGMNKNLRTGPDPDTFNF
ncbi:Glyoxal reductase [bioreactor metagenome]|uniref:Glyoxal reductase n=1 Tax=bioreactor metagenome TaxID=1076179 RepID=A0A644Z394_9ZZZZ